MEGRWRGRIQLEDSFEKESVLPTMAQVRRVRLIGRKTYRKTRLGRLEVRRFGVTRLGVLRLGVPRLRVLRLGVPRLGAPRFELPTQRSQAWGF